MDWSFFDKTFNLPSPAESVAIICLWSKAFSILFETYIIFKAIF